MYYLFNDSGEHIDECERLGAALECATLFNPRLIVLYSGEYTKRKDIWEHGIEVMAPSPENREFIYWAKWKRKEPWEDPETGHIFDDWMFSTSAPTMEIALENLKKLCACPDDPLLDYGIEERITITHKVKL